MNKHFFFILPLLCISCTSNHFNTNGHYLLQDTRIAIETGRQNHFSSCAPIAFAEAEAHLIMANHEFSEGNMDRTDAQALQQKAKLFIAQAQKKCAYPTPENVKVKTSQPALTIVKEKTELIQLDFKETILFATNSTSLSELSEQKLEQVIHRIHDKNNINISISGHSDERGKTTYNQQLSCARTNTIFRYFLHAGIHIKDIHPRCFGANKPLSIGHNEVSWKQNRRVTIHISKKLRLSTEKKEKL